MYAGRHLLLSLFLRCLILLYEFTLWVSITRDEFSESAFALNEHTFLTFRAFLACFLWLRDLGTLDGPRTLALREFRAAEEPAVPSQLYDHRSLACGTPDLFWCISQIRDLGALISEPHFFLEWYVKITKRFLVFLFTCRDLVKILFHLCGEGVADDASEILLEE